MTKNKLFAGASPSAMEAWRKMHEGYEIVSLGYDEREGMIVPGAAKSRYFFDTLSDGGFSDYHC